MITNRHDRLALLLGLTLAGLTACGSDDADTATSRSTSPTTVVATTVVATDVPATTDGPVATDTPTTEHDHDEMPMVSIGVQDYAFADVPASVAAGTAISITNASATEVHELVAVKLADDDTRPVREIVQLPVDQLGALIGAQPATVIIAPPMSPGFAVVGDGTLAEPGRYLLLCTIPIGADPDEYLAAAAASAANGGGPPQVAGGAPHFTAGMFAEIVVESEA